MRVGRLEFIDRTLQRLGVLKALSELTLGTGTNILASNSTDGATATPIPFSEGSNANGRWQRVGGKLECWHTLTATFSGVAVLEVTWTFPTAFNPSASPVVIAGLKSASTGATPGIQEIAEVYTNSAPSNTSAIIRVVRQITRTNFVLGDTLVLSCFAIGEAP